MDAKKKSTAALLAAIVGATGFLACGPPPVTCDGLTPTIVGTAGADTLTGTPTADVIAGLGGNDTITSLGGHDLVCGGDGRDQIDGGADNDRLDGGALPDRIEGGSGVDTVTYARHGARVSVDLSGSLGGDNDTLVDLENIIGTPYADQLEGDDGANDIHGLGGGDLLYGRGGTDRLFDTSTTLGDINHLYGGPGDDGLVGGGGDDRAAYDTSGYPIHADLRTGAVTGQGTDSLSGINGILGSFGNDTLLGDARSNHIEGGPGDDFVMGQGGEDQLFGGEGTDRASWANLTAAVFVDLAHEYASGDGPDRVAEFEHFTGGWGNDTLRGDAKANEIDGYHGTDTCTGGGGADTFLRCP